MCLLLFMLSKVGNYGKIAGSIFLCVLIFGTAVWVFSPILTPFVLGAVWAYAYHPIMRVLRRWGISALWSALLMTLFTYILIIVLVGALFPFIRDISSSLTLHAVQSRQIIWNGIQPFVNKIFKETGPQIRENFDSLLLFGARWATTAAVYILENGWALAQLLFSLLLSPIIGFYLMKDWENIRIRLLTLVPIPYRGPVLAGVCEINTSLSRFFRGQLGVCAVLGIYYSIGLSALSLRGGMILGILTGLLLFIPYIGFLTCMVSACLASLAQTGDPNDLVFVLCLYGGGQLLESMILTPLMIGKRTGLHPVWILFFIFAGGLLKGIVGILLALPVATLLGVCWRLSRRIYMQSSFYHSGWKETFLNR